MADAIKQSIGKLKTRGDLLLVISYTANGGAFEKKLGWTLDFPLYVLFINIASHQFGMTNVFPVNTDTYPGLYKSS
jgi:hypothetical protein